jgi:hypothetical protein
MDEEWKWWWWWWTGAGHVKEQDGREEGADRRRI